MSKTTRATSMSTWSSVFYFAVFTDWTVRCCGLFPIFNRWQIYWQSSHHK